MGNWSGGNSRDTRIDDALGPPRIFIRWSYRTTDDKIDGVSTSG